MQAALGRAGVTLILAAAFAFVGPARGLAAEPDTSLAGSDRVYLFECGVQAWETLVEPDSSDPACGASIRLKDLRWSGHVGRSGVAGAR
jgi:hypothetical protein